MSEMEKCCVREMTVEEEIKALEISDETKEIIIRKWERLVKENHLQGEALNNCHFEIDRLNKAVISLSKWVGVLEEEVNNKSIHCEL